MMIVAVTGASGFIGSRLVPRLQQEGYRVRAVGRRDPGIDNVEFVVWDPVRVQAPASALADAGAVIHLAGAPVAHRWNAVVKRRIRDSRVLGTRNLVSTLENLNTRPEIMISASAIGYYGDRGDEILVESSAPGKDFLAEVCVEWEREAKFAGTCGLRTAVLRIGIVLGNGGGALKQLVPVFKSGLGGPVGAGHQWMSWIHVDDVVGMMLFILRNAAVFGAVNAVSPEPVRNAEFARMLGSVLHRPSLMHTPEFALRLAFGEMASVVLASQRVIPDVASRAGFAFHYPSLREALAQLLT